jgi:hypothetical protein
VYWPNPAHKIEATDAGPPQWSPDKEKCPVMSSTETNELLESSIPLDESDPTSRRFAVRLVAGAFEFFEAKFTQIRPEGQLEFHGHPTRRVPAVVLRRFRSRLSLSEAQYRRLLAELTVA